MSTREPLDEHLDGEGELVEVEAVWCGEIAHRVQEIERGAVTLDDGPSAMRRLRDRARARLRRCASP
jgi:hypothetical protein